MKIIVSHDVDHLSVVEHGADLMVPKFLLRSSLECGLGKIQAKEIVQRFWRTLSNRWNNIEELMAFDSGRCVPATYFIGVSNGRQLSYSFSEAGKWIEKILRADFEVGVHGICYDCPEGISREFDRFRNVTGGDNIGVRMHCLSHNDDTLSYLEKSGYRFDSTLSGFRNPFRLGRGMWEFPLQLMDADLLCNGSRWQNRGFEEAKMRTLQMINNAERDGLNYFSVLFHDFYFTDAFQSWKRWYIWFVNHLRRQGYEFVSYTGAIEELEGRGN